MTRFEPGDVVVVPFPFTDFVTLKQRPCVVLSSARFNGPRPDVRAAVAPLAGRPERPIAEGGRCVGFVDTLRDGGAPARPGELLGEHHVIARLAPLRPAAGRPAVAGGDRRSRLAGRSDGRLARGGADVLEPVGRRRVALRPGQVDPAEETIVLG